jgi:hypothetical protein
LSPFCEPAEQPGRGVYRRRLLHGEQVLDDAGECAKMRHDPGTSSLLDDDLDRLACGCEIGDRDQFRPLENVDNRLRAGGPMLDR